MAAITKALFLFWHFPNISISPKILSLKLHGNSWSNSYKVSFILNIKYHFTYDEFKLNVYAKIGILLSIKWKKSIEAAIERYFTKTGVLQKMLCTVAALYLRPKSQTNNSEGVYFSLFLQAVGNFSNFSKNETPSQAFSKDFNQKCLTPVL